MKDENLTAALRYELDQFGGVGYHTITLTRIRENSDIFDMVETGKIAVTSSGLLKIPDLHEFLGATICRAPIFRRRRDIQAVAGWGAKKSGLRAERIADRLAVPVLLLEDGFLRSMLPGRNSRQYSMVKDYKGIYYDSTRPSTLENLLNSSEDLLAGIAADVDRARALIIDHKLSKYNHAPLLDPFLLRDEDRQRVLVVDQTVGDNSVAMGGADASTFALMLSAALDENPQATVYIKTHPEVSLGKKRGYLSDIQDDRRVVLLRQAINPIDLVLNMDKVYTVTSTMGFEALLAGKKVTSFGISWYAGWGVSDDRQHCHRRVRSRTIDELFAAAYFHYTTYLNPRNARTGTIFDVIEWLVEQKSEVT